VQKKTLSFFVLFLHVFFGATKLEKKRPSLGVIVVVETEELGVDVVVYVVPFWWTSFTRGRIPRGGGEKDDDVNDDENNT